MDEYKNINVKIPISLYNKIKGIECITDIKIKEIVKMALYLYIKKYLNGGVDNVKRKEKNSKRNC